VDQEHAVGEPLEAAESKTIELAAAHQGLSESSTLRKGNAVQEILSKAIDL
jgi:hypothetical protein